MQFMATQKCQAKKLPPGKGGRRMIEYKVEKHVTTEYIVVVTGTHDNIRECVAKCPDEVFANRIAKELTAEHKRAVNRRPK